jgi:hypothetical protein
MESNVVHRSDDHSSRSVRDNGLILHLIAPPIAVSEVVTALRYDWSVDSA